MLEDTSQPEGWPGEPGPVRPYALVGGTPSGEAGPGEEPVPAWGAEGPPVASKPGRETYREDVPLAVIAAALAGSTFLPWYTGPRGFSLSISAWSSGTWGPVIFFLGAASFLMIVLRRIGVGVSIPVDESLFHEGVGWLSLAGAVVKSRFRPESLGVTVGLSYGLWVALGAAVLLIVVAGRMSPHAPLVLRPGWFKGRAGTVGALLLVAMIAGGAVFGTTNSASLLATPGGTRSPGFTQGRIPDCARGFPIPATLTPGQGNESPCQIQLLAKKSAGDVIAEFKAGLQGINARFVEQQTAGSPSLVVTAPRCATVVAIGAESGSFAVVAFDICSATPAPPASPTSSPT